MAWAAIADKSSTWSGARGDLIDDPDIQDTFPFTDWLIVHGLGFPPGLSAFTGSQLVFSGDTAIVRDIDYTSTIGRKYQYTVDIDSYTAGVGQIKFGNVELWNQNDGAGIFRGTITSSAATGLEITAGLVIPTPPAATYTINRISILEDPFVSIDDKSSSWSTSTVSTTWTPDTDETTSWS